MNRFFALRVAKAELIVLAVTVLTVFVLATGKSGIFLLTKSFIQAQRDLISDNQYIPSRFVNGSAGSSYQLLNGEAGEFDYFVSGQVDPSFIGPDVKGVNGHKLMSEYTTMVWNTLIEGGCTMEGAAAIMGNMSCEGAMPAYAGKAFNGITVEGRADPTANQAYTDKLDSGELTEDDFQFCVETPGASASSYRPTGYGLVQWSSPYKGGAYTGDRKRNLYKFAKSEGLSIGSPELQASFVIQELNSGSYNTTRDAVFQSNDLSLCTATAEFDYETHSGIHSTWKSITDVQNDQNNSGSRNPYNRYQNAKIIYDIYRAAAEDYAASHSSANYVRLPYGGTILPANFAQMYNVDERRMTADRWKVIESGYILSEVYQKCLYTQGNGEYVTKWQRQQSVHGADYDLIRALNWSTCQNYMNQDKYFGTDCTGFVCCIYDSVGVTVDLTYTGHRDSDPGSYKNALANGDSRLKKVKDNMDDALAGDPFWNGTGHVEIFLGWQNKAAGTFYRMAAHGADKTGDPWYSDLSGYPNSVSCGGTGTVTNSFYIFKLLPNGTGTTYGANTESLFSKYGIEEGQGVLWIGDSRTVGVGMNVASLSDNWTCSSEHGSGYPVKMYIKDKFVIVGLEGGTFKFLDDTKIQSMIDDAIAKDQTILLALGTNDLNAATCKDRIEQIQNKGGRVVFLTTFGVKAGASITNAGIEAFNADVIASGVPYLDLYKWFKSEYPNGPEGSANIHASNSQSKAIYDWVKSSFQPN